MINKGPLIFYHAPQSRAAGVLCLLEELGAEYQIKSMNLRKGDHLKPEYMAINPMGKVPAIHHNGHIVTEQVAIYIYLADVFHEAGLAPKIGDPLRGPFLRWMAFYGSSFEPAVTDKSMKRDPAPRATSPYANFDTMYKTFHDHLEKNKYFLGDQISSVDILWGGALNWMTMFKLIPETPTVMNYVKSIMTRPASVRAQEIETKILAELS